MWYLTQKKTQPGQDGPNASGWYRSTGDSLGRFCCYYCSTLINCDSNFSMRGTFLKTMLPLPDNYELLPTPREIYNDLSDLI